MLPETCLKAFRRLGQQGVDDAAIDIHDIVADPVFLEPLIDDFTGSRPGGGQVCACCELSTGEADAKSEAFHGCGMASGPTHFRHKKRRGTRCGSDGWLALVQSPRLQASHMLCIVPVLPAMRQHRAVRFRLPAAELRS